MGWRYRKYVLISVMLILVVGSFVTADFEILDSPRYYADQPSPPLTPRRRVAQEFLVRGELSRLSIRFGTHGRKPSGRLHLKILDSQNRRVAIQRYDAGGIADNDFTHFRFDQPIEKGRYTLVMRYFPENRKDRLSVWMTRDNRYPWGRMEINRREVLGDMVFRVYHRASGIRSLGFFFRRFQVIGTPLLFILLLFYGILVLMALLIVLRTPGHG